MSILDRSTATALAAEYTRVCALGAGFELRIETNGRGLAVVAFIARGTPWRIAAVSLPLDASQLGPPSVGDVLRAIADVLDDPMRYATIEATSADPMRYATIEATSAEASAADTAHLVRYNPHRYGNRK